MTGILSYHAGLSAESQVERVYETRGFTISDRRWRGRGGEIDLIARGEDDDTVVFIEVKKSRDHARAAERLSGRQIGRLCDAASEYLGHCPQGLNTPARFDVALVDSIGRVRIIENAITA
jgi:putative endonuclease